MSTAFQVPGRLSLDTSVNFEGIDWITSTGDISGGRSGVSVGLNVVFRISLWGSIEDMGFRLLKKASIGNFAGMIASAWAESWGACTLRCFDFFRWVTACDRDGEEEWVGY